MGAKELLKYCVKDELKELAEKLLAVEETATAEQLKKANELYEKNYNNQGDCEGLEKYYKSMDKKFAILTYLPWVTAERIFQKQGGRIEVIDLCKEIKSKKTEIDFASGAKMETEKTSYFVHLKAYWQGRTLEEFYPVFNTSMAVISSPDSKDLNTSKQRGMARLIARISGIGVKMYENSIDDATDEQEKKTQPTKAIPFIQQ